MDPVFTGIYEADKTGKVVFTFDHGGTEDDARQVKFSGITVRECHPQPGFDS